MIIFNKFNKFFFFPFFQHIATSLIVIKRDEASICDELKIICQKTTTSDANSKRVHKKGTKKKILPG